MTPGLAWPNSPLLTLTITPTGLQSLCDSEQVKTDSGPSLLRSSSRLFSSSPQTSPRKKHSGRPNVHAWLPGLLLGAGALPFVLYNLTIALPSKNSPSKKSPTNSTLESEENETQALADMCKTAAYPPQKSQTASPRPRSPSVSAA